MNGIVLRQTTRIEEVNDESLSVLVAVDDLQRRPLDIGVGVTGHYMHRHQPWHFTSEVIGHSDDGLMDVLALPDDATKADRRRFFRMPVTLSAQRIYRVLPATDHLDEEDGSEVDATIVDLSEGGMQLRTRTLLNVGDVLDTEASLPGIGYIEARSSVVRVRAPSRRQLNYRVSCAFTRIENSHRQLIARYLMGRQLEMRRNGQL